MNPVVSVLVPVYNVSMYIEKCAYSLFNQTLKNVEYIFVNDACTDDSVKKLENVISQYNQLKPAIQVVNNTENLGQSKSRDKAIDLAKGDYILFVDSDDYIDVNMLEVMYEEANRTNADIVVCDMLIEFTNQKVYFKDVVSAVKRDNFVNMISNNGTSPSLCNKLVKRSLYQMSECRNTLSMKYMEDRFISTRLYYIANKIAKVDGFFYHYIKFNPNSANSKVTQRHFQDMKLFWDSVESFLKNRGELKNYKNLIDFLKVKDKATLMLGTNSVKLRKEFANMFDNTGWSVLKKLATGEKILMLLVRYKLFFATQILRQLIVYKNRIY